MSILNYKKADLNNDGQNQAFESTFSQIAHAYLQDRAPGLLDYEVGFQLVERDDDHNKAFGVFGFKVGPNWLFAPVFFIDGKLKGKELLYIKRRDLFVPLKDTWVDYLLSRSPIELGRDVARDTQRIGVRAPDIALLTQSPRKFASAKTKASLSQEEQQQLHKEAMALPWNKIPDDAMDIINFPDWAKLACFDMAKCAAGRPEDNDPVITELIALQPEISKYISKLWTSYPLLKDAFDRMIPAEKMASAIKRARKRIGRIRTRRSRRKRAAVGSLDATLHPNNRLRIFSLDRFDRPLPLDFDDQDRKNLLLSGILIKDAREGDETSTAYATPTKIDIKRQLSNPNASGLWDVIDRNGDLVRCLVIMAPWGPAGRNPLSLIVRIGDSATGKKPWVLAHPSLVWANKRYERIDENEFFQNLPIADNAVDDLQMVISQAFEASLPFTKTNVYGSTNGRPVIEANFRDYSHYELPGAGYRSSDPIRLQQEYTNSDYNSFHDGSRIHFDQESGSRLSATRGDLFVPSSARRIELKNGDSQDNGEPAIDLGSLRDIELGLRRVGDDLTVSGDEKQGYRIDFNGVGHQYSFQEALIHLVRGHGLKEAAARDILSAANKNQFSPMSFLIKHADGYPSPPYLTSPDQYAMPAPEPMLSNDSIMGNNQLTQQFQEDLVGVPGLLPDPSDRYKYRPQDDDLSDFYQGAQPDPNAIEMAQRAAQRGQRELFDTTMFSNMLRAIGDDRLIDDDVDGIEKGMDRVGRQLLKFYWHPSQYEERYGSDDIPELEDALRNCFDSMGDLVLFMRTRSIESDPSEAARSIDLGPISEQ